MNMSSKASFTSVDSLVTDSPNTMSQDGNSKSPDEDRDADAEKQQKIFTPFSIRDILEENDR